MVDFVIYAYLFLYFIKHEKLPHIVTRGKKSTTNESINKSEWLLFNTNSAMFQLYHGKLIFNEMMMSSALY